MDRVEGNAYVVVTDDGLLQVDSGLPGNARRICRFIEAIGHDPGEVHDIVLTHYDGDHVGSAAALKARTGARVCIHEADAPVLTREQKPGQRMPRFVRILYRLLMKPLTPDRMLRDGDMVGGLRVMHIPGHTPGINMELPLLGLVEEKEERLRLHNTGSDMIYENVFNPAAKH